jgi:3-hydroxybutyryl-CoA dehydratase
MIYTQGLNMLPPQPASKRAFNDISLGEDVSIQIQITTEMIDRFAELSGDFSPIHISQEVARERGFADRVGHGFLTGSLISRILGMMLPGEYGLLHNVSLQFPKPVYPEDVLTVRALVKDKQDAYLLIFLDVTVTNQRAETVCKGKIQMGVAR